MHLGSLTVPTMLLGLALLSPARAHAQDDARTSEALRLCGAGQLDQGIRILAEVYADTDNPSAIYNQARCYHQNRRPDLAGTRLREYLRKANGLSPQDRAGVERLIAQTEAEMAAANRAPTAAPAPTTYAAAPAQPVAAPGAPGSYAGPPAAPPAAPVDRPVKRSRKKGLMIAGLATLGGSYAFTALVGLTALSQQDKVTGNTIETCINCETVGTRFLIPIIGPWLALPEADGDDGKAIAAVLGLAQAAGLTMSIIGISKFVASGKEPPPEATARLHFGVAPALGGGVGLVSGRF